MTHLTTTFIVISTNGEGVFFGLAENGEVAAGNYDTRLDAVQGMLAYEAKLAADRPLVVVIGKNTPRATTGEKFLEDFSRQVVRAAVAKLPETSPVYVAGSAGSVRNSFYSPRVCSLPLPWATKKTSRIARVRSLLSSLATGEDGLALIPKARTYVR